MPVLPIDPDAHSTPVEVTADALSNLRQHALCSSTGGFFPVGLYGTWHGGIHLTAHPVDAIVALGSPVHMPTSGDVVAVRLGGRDSPAKTTLGSTNFVLTRHYWKDSPYFMLFQHLELTGANALIRGETGPDRACPSWLATACGHRVATEVNMRADPFGDVIGMLHAGDRVLLRGGPLDPVEPTDAFGADTRGALTDLNVPVSAHVRDEDGYVWARIRVLTSSGDIEAGTVGAMAIRKLDADRDYIDGRGLLSVADRQSLASGQITCLSVPVQVGDVIGWSGPYGPEDRSSALPELSDTARTLMRQHLGRDGRIASLQIPGANMVHWEVFSEAPVLGLEEHMESVDRTNHASASSSASIGATDDSAHKAPAIRWKQAQDLDNDLAINSERVLGALTEAQEMTTEGWPWSENTRDLTQEEVLRFYVDGYGTRLQNCVCRFHTAWGLADVESTAEAAGWDVEATRALQWWGEVEGQVKDFPKTKHVWHYPPTEALRAIQWQLNHSHPQFFVEMGGERHEVKRFEDIRNLVFADLDVASTTIPEFTEAADSEQLDEVQGALHGVDVNVQVQDTQEFFASVLLSRSSFGWLGGEWFAGVGSARRDTPDLYELLIDPADTDGVPDLSDFDANVWASISHSEGHLQAINTYDTAFVSVGPIQQTVGARNYKGELQGALDTAQSEVPDAYEEHLGRHGLEVVQPAVELGAKKAHFKLDDTVLDDPDSKHQLRDFLWAHRLAETFNDPRMREPMLREGFRRLKRIRERDIEFEVKVDGTKHTIESTIGEIFRTDLAQALLLDTHINLPALVWSHDADTSIAIETAQEVFTAEGITMPSRLTRDQDLKLIAVLMQQRSDTTMADPVGRAIGILKYTDTDVVEELARANTDDSVSQGVAAYLDLVFDMTPQTAQQHWADIQAFDRTVLSLKSV